jgi:hypothetical protein
LIIDLLILKKEIENGVDQQDDKASFLMRKNRFAPLS